MLEPLEKHQNLNNNSELCSDQDVEVWAESEDAPVLEVELEPNYALEARAIVDDAFMDAGRSSKGRVRFVAPVMMRSDERIEASQGSILNLSVGGVACAASLDLHIDQHVWLRFRPEPAAEPGQFYCRVKWCHRPVEGNPIYGLEFVDLPQQEEKTFREVIGEGGHEEKITQHLNFELDDELPRSALRSRRSRLLPTALLGMLVGILTALLLALVPYTGIRGDDIWGSFVRWANAAERPLPDVTLKQVVPKKETSSSQKTQSVEALSKENIAAVQKNVDVQKEAVVPVESLRVQESDTQGDIDGESQQEPAVKQETGPKNATNQIEPLSIPGAVRIDLGKAKDNDAEVKTFWLSEPRRLVIDLPATQSPYEGSSYDVAHPLIKQLRIGTYPNKVRYVIDAAEGVPLESELGVLESGERWIELRRLSNKEKSLDQPEEPQSGN